MMISKIQTKGEKEKKRKQNQLIVGGVMIFLLVLSTAGFSLLSSGDNNSNSEYKDNGFKFYSEGGYFATEISGQVYRFKYLPSQVTDVEIEGEYDLNSYIGQPIYFVGETSVASEILVNLQSFVLRYQEACLEGGECSNEELPVKTCSDNLIVYKNNNAEQTKIYKEENCVFMEGDLTKASNAFVYKLLRVI